MYTGPDSDPYRSNTPPWHVLAEEADKRGMKQQAKMIRDALNRSGWRA
jgi:hypothetical protein